MRPSSGVKPMVVSTLTPPWIAASEAPLPRWQVIMRRELQFFAQNIGGAAAEYWWLMP